MSLNFKTFSKLQGLPTLNATPGRSQYDLLRDQLAVYSSRSSQLEQQFILLNAARIALSNPGIDVPLDEAELCALECLDCEVAWPLPGGDQVMIHRASFYGDDTLWVQVGRYVNDETGAKRDLSFNAPIAILSSSPDVTSLLYSGETGDVSDIDEMCQYLTEGLREANAKAGILSGLLDGSVDPSALVSASCGDPQSALYQELMTAASHGRSFLISTMATEFLTDFGGASGKPAFVTDDSKHTVISINTAYWLPQAVNLVVQTAITVAAFAIGNVPGLICLGIMAIANGIEQVTEEVMEHARYKVSNPNGEDIISVPLFRFTDPDQVNPSDVPGSWVSHQSSMCLLDVLQCGSGDEDWVMESFVTTGRVLRTDKFGRSNIIDPLKEEFPGEFNLFSDDDFVPNFSYDGSAEASHVLDVHVAEVALKAAESCLAFETAKTFRNMRDVWVPTAQSITDIGCVMSEDSSFDDDNEALSIDVKILKAIQIVYEISHYSSHYAITEWKVYNWLIPAVRIINSVCFLDRYFHSDINPDKDPQSPFFFVPKYTPPIVAADSLELAVKIAKIVAKAITVAAVAYKRYSIRKAPEKFRFFDAAGKRYMNRYLRSRKLSDYARSKYYYMRADSWRQLLPNPIMYGLYDGMANSQSSAIQLEDVFNAFTTTEDGGHATVTTLKNDILDSFTEVKSDFSDKMDGVLEEYKAAMLEEVASKFVFVRNSLEELGLRVTTAIKVDVSVDDTELHSDVRLLMRDVETTANQVSSIIRTLREYQLSRRSVQF